MPERHDIHPNRSKASYSDPTRHGYPDPHAPTRRETPMDSEMRRRFLQLLNADFARLDLHDAGVACPSGGRWEPTGPRLWPHIRAWWLADQEGDTDA